MNRTNEENAKEYFNSLAQTVKRECMTEIHFKSHNSFFYKDESKGIIPCSQNRQHSNFDYILKLPKYDEQISEEMAEKVNLLNLVAVKIRPFEAVDSQFSSYAAISPDLMVIVSQLGGDGSIMRAELVAKDRN